jgi:hypothetical protein
MWQRESLDFVLAHIDCKTNWDILFMRYVQNTNTARLDHAADRGGALRDETRSSTRNMGSVISNKRSAKR